MMDLATFMAVAVACAPLADPATSRAVVATESAFNPNAIGVVGGALERQPRSRPEALATARMLRAQGWNYSLGLAQINARNLARLGLDVETAFEPCANLEAMQTVLLECFERAMPRRTSAQRALRAALSCYYSGNFVTGVHDGYVHRVVSASRAAPPAPPPLHHPAKEPS